MNGVEFVNCADRWIQDTTASESVLRSCVSRAYYGSLHRSSEFMTSVLRIHIERGSSKHKKLPVALGYSDNEVLRKVGFLLADIRDRRCDADYELTKTNAGQRSFAVEVLSQAREIVTNLDSFSVSGLQLRQIQSSIEKHFNLYLTGYRIISRL